MSKVILETIYKIISNYPGFFSYNETIALGSATLSLPDKSLIVELGSLYGRSSALFSEIAQINDLDVICIDNFCGNSETEPYFRENILDRYRNTKLIKATTDEAVFEFSDETIDLLFIDANHQEDGILNDCKNYLPKVKHNGIVAFHDYFHQDFPSVKKWVDVFTEDWEVLAEADSLIIKRKP